MTAPVSPPRIERAPARGSAASPEARRGPPCGSGAGAKPSQAPGQKPRGVRVPELPWRPVPRGIPAGRPHRTTARRRCSRPAGGWAWRRSTPGAGRAALSRRARHRCRARPRAAGERRRARPRGGRGETPAARGLSRRCGLPGAMGRLAPRRHRLACARRAAVCPKPRGGGPETGPPPPGLRDLPDGEAPGRSAPPLPRAPALRLVVAGGNAPGFRPAPFSPSRARARRPRPPRRRRGPLLALARPGPPSSPAVCGRARNSRPRAPGPARSGFSGRPPRCRRPPARAAGSG